MAKINIPATKDQSYVGSHFTNEESAAGKVTNFFSHYISPVFIIPEEENGNKRRIRFKERMYSTAVESEKKFLRNHPVFNIQIFEGTYPEWYLEDEKKRNKYLTKDAMLHEAGE